MKATYKNGFRYVGNVGHGMHPLAWSLGYYISDLAGVTAQSFYSFILAIRYGWYKEKWFWTSLTKRICNCK